jgi:uncharacterized protein
MTREEWELLCDGCGRCCLHKLQDKKTGRVFYTCIACRYLDIHKCRCTIYNDPYVVHETCRKITPDNIHSFDWLPNTCAYRRLAQKRNLDWWHPLVSGDGESVHTAGVSVRNCAVPEGFVHQDDIESCIIDLPE